MPPFVAELAAVGVDFETRATAGAQPVTIPPGTEKEFFRGERTVYLPPSSRLFRNEPLRLRGRPDGVVSAGGVVEPIEIKSHRRVRESDVIELAFYWRLLEPLRSVDAVPAGWVFLRSPDGSVTEQRMAIPAGVFAQLDAAIRGVRQARINGVPQDRFCRCAVCGGIKRDEVRRRAISAQDVSTVIGVGRSYGAALRACGVDRWPSLLAADPDVLADKVRFEDSKCRSVSANLVRRWQAHARALRDDEARWVDLPQEFPIPTSYIALDLEYIPEYKDVWLIGARVVDPENGDVSFSCWSDREGNAQALTRISDLIDAHPGLAVVTYNGRSADLPMLRAVAERCGAQMLMTALQERHVDLYHWLMHSLMLPTLDFGLKTISKWAGIARTGDVTSGLQATSLYLHYRHSADPAIRDRLLSYNREDVDGLVEVIEHLRQLVNGSAGEKYTHNEVAQVIDVIHETAFAPSSSSATPEFRPISTRGAAGVKNASSSGWTGRWHRAA